MSDNLSLAVPLLDLRMQYDSMRDEIQSTLVDVCESQHFVLGPRVVEFEETVACYSQCKYGIGVSSGSDALIVALMALDVGPGDEVITAPFTFFASAGAIARIGATPVFCDIDPLTYNISPDAIEDFLVNECHWSDAQLVNKRTGGRVKVIMPVHLFGQVAEMSRLLELAKKYNLKIVEDAAQSIGAETESGRRAGSIGDIGCFSFFPSKNLGAYGDGGLCTTQDERLAKKLRTLRVHGSSPKYFHALIGGNFRLDSIQAAILSVKFKYLDQWSAKRAENAAFYDQALNIDAAEIQIPHRSQKVRHVFNQYTIRSKDRNALIQHLTDANVGTAIYYPLPLHLQRCFDYLGYKKGDFPVSEAAAESVLSIPIFPEISEAQLEKVANCINEFSVSKRRTS